jgi:hypothetical protein
LFELQQLEPLATGAQVLAQSWSMLQTGMQPAPLPPAPLPPAPLPPAPDDDELLPDVVGPDVGPDAPAPDAPAPSCTWAVSPDAHAMKMLDVVSASAAKARLANFIGVW